MGSVPMYNLTWGEYGTSLISAVQLLRCHGELVDVTLAAGGRTFHAHKVVLCAASPFLLDLLKSTTCKHPVVMLAGVQAADLEALLEFVYRGEVSIDQNQLPSLLQAAHCLSIQGLSPSSNPLHNEHVHQQQQLHSVKTINEKSEMLESEVSQNENEIAAAKRKKRIKRSRSPPVAIHDEKVYIPSSNNPTDSVQETSSNVNAPMWAQQMNIINVATSTTMDSLSSQTSVPMQNIATTSLVGNNNLSGQSPMVHVANTKVKGASDQPGVCPLCGAMLRQARNLRRHLVTSCKYRIIGGIPPQTGNTSTIHMSRELTPLQPVPIESVERVDQNNSEQIDTKPVVLTPISCTKHIPSNASIISVTTSTLH